MNHNKPNNNNNILCMYTNVYPRGGSFGYFGAGGSLQAAFKKGYLRNAPRI